MPDWKTYQGIEVSDFDPKVKFRHPRWGYDPKTLGTLKGASLLALADETYLVVCNECGYNGLTGREPYVKPEGEYLPIVKQADRVSSHINGMHHPNKTSRRTSLYTDDQIRDIIRVWMKWRNTGIRSWTKSAVEELERKGIRSSRGGRWTPGGLGSLARTYSKQPKFKNIKPPVANQEALAELVRESAAREVAAGHPTVVASNARITETRKPNSRIDFDKIINDQQKEEPVVASPKLTFGSEVTPIKNISVETTEPPPAASETVLLPDADFQFIATMHDGTLLFMYRGSLMAAKRVKNIET